VQSVSNLHTYALGLKRLMDVLGAAFGLLALLPVLVVIAIVVKLDSPGPSLFRQVRVGQNGRLFRIFKFRTMVIDAARVGTALTVRNDTRITRVGSILRETKLDELPQLINVLAGDMSIVGPRPEVPDFMSFYTPEQRAVILSLKPGLTDYAAILFRDESSLLDHTRNPIEVYRHEIMPIKFFCYERYSHEAGISTDLRIIVATLLMLISKRVPRWLRIEWLPSRDGVHHQATSMIRPVVWGPNASATTAPDAPVQRSKKSGLGDIPDNQRPYQIGQSQWHSLPPSHR
jgi:lipopolysaccharide/colanic/teichoic acid biosynthesis glycosyltransferase